MDRETLRRFTEKVEIVGDCWVWQGATLNGRYGKMKVKGKSYLAHRLAWEHKHGSIAQGLTVDHLVEEGVCTTTLCVRPKHLQLLTRRANNLKQHGSTETHFKCGHTKESWNVSSGRGCATCRRFYEDTYYRNKA